MPTTNSPAGALEQDVPCARCGYDLRGLTPPGRCPECGFDLMESVRAHATRSPGWLPPDPVWARQIREGVWLSLIVFGLSLFAVLAPAEWYDLPYRNAPLSRTPGRIIFLAIGCCWWVLSWASVWKLTTIEPPTGGRRSWRSWGRAARALCTAHFVIPFVWAIDPSEYKPTPFLFLLITLLLGGLVGCLALFVRIGQLLRRQGANIAAGEAWGLSAIVMAMTFLDLGRGDNGPSSLSLMFDLPVYPYGMPWIYCRMRNYGWFDAGEPLVWIHLALPLWSVLLMLRLLWVYRPAWLRRSNAAASG